MAGPDPATTAEVLALVQAQAAARQQIADLTTAAVTAEVRAFGGWYDTARITTLAARLAKLTRAGQKQTATSTDSFAARILTLLTGQRRRVVGPVPVADLWGGVPLENVYGRLADQYRWLEATRGPQAPPEARISLVTGDPLPVLSEPEILSQVVTRAEVQSDTALTLAFREQWVSDLAKVGTVTGYRRVIHPELTKGGSCGLCVAASDQVYHKKDLLPVHGRCKCTVTPIFGETLGPGDPGAAINSEDLAKMYEAAGGSTSGFALKETRYRVVDHGELGPQLVYADAKFRTAEQARASERKQAEVRSGRPQAQRAAGGTGTYKAAKDIQVNPAVVLKNAEAKIRELEDRAAKGEDVSAPLSYQRGLAERMRARL
jgi:hypothetical protein